MIDHRATGRAPKLTRLLPLVLAGLLVLSACSSAAEADETIRDDSGTVEDGGDVGVFRLQVGDCLNGEVADELESLPVVPCDEPHQSQIYTSFDLVGDEYPGLLTVENLSGDGCFDRFESTFGEPYEVSPYYISFIYPTSDSWDRADDREVLCVAAPDYTLTESILP